jgi:hypothetical protein
MKRHIFYLALIFMIVNSCPAFAQSIDLRNMKNAVGIIPDEGYCDQPYTVKTLSNEWLCVITTGPGGESQKGQHVSAIISADQGKSWSKPIDIEKASDQMSSWATPYITPYGRIYVFYNYNGDGVFTTPDGKSIPNSALLGWYCYKYSDDHGRTWSKRFRLPLRKTTVDYMNNWHGEVQLFWGISKPIQIENSMYFALTKMGKYHADVGEGWFFKSDNISTEKNAEKLNWQLLPDGEQGLSTAALGLVQEEHNIVGLNDGGLYCVYRTNEGFPAHSYSRDQGRTWTKPEFMTYEPNGQVVKNPRACPRLFKCANGKYLLWYHNHSQVVRWQHRNPAWVSGGVEKDGVIHWSQPEILLYETDTSARMSYPDLIEENGKFWITETQKEVAGVHAIDPILLEGLWKQASLKTIAKSGLVAEKYNPDKSSDVGVISPLNLTKGGFAIDLWLTLDELKPGQILLDNTDSQGKGISISVTKQRTLEITLTDGKYKSAWDTDPGVIQAGKPQHVVFNVDGGPNIITTVVNGKLCDGGRYRPFGWTWFSDLPEDVNTSVPLKLSPEGKKIIKQIRLYNRYLTTSEAIGNFRAGHQ